MIDEVLHVVHFHSTVLDVVPYTYESNTMYLHTLKVHSNIDVTKVEHICVIDEVLHVVHFHSTALDVY